jgi:hypothetical protein
VCRVSPRPRDVKCPPDLGALAARGASSLFNPSTLTRKQRPALARGGPGGVKRRRCHVRWSQLRSAHPLYRYRRWSPDDLDTPPSRPKLRAEGHATDRADLSARRQPAVPARGRHGQPRQREPQNGWPLLGRPLFQRDSLRQFRGRGSELRSGGWAATTRPKRVSGPQRSSSSLPAAPRPSRRPP